MKSQLFWLVPDHILYWKLAGEISADDLCVMSKAILNQAQQAKGQKVHIILEGTGIQQIDPLSTDANIAFNALAKNTRIGKVMAILRSMKVQLQFNALNRGFGLNWRNVNSFVEATQQLKNADRSLRAVPNTPPKDKPLESIN